MQFEYSDLVQIGSDRSWSIVLYLGRDAITGKKRQKWHTFYGNKKGAQAEMNRLIYELNTGTYIEPGKLTVGHYLQKWLNDYAKMNVGLKRLSGTAQSFVIILCPPWGAFRFLSCSHCTCNHAIHGGLKAAEKMETDGSFGQTLFKRGALK